MSFSLFAPILQAWGFPVLSGCFFAVSFQLANDVLLRRCISSFRLLSRLQPSAVISPCASNRAGVLLVPVHRLFFNAVKVGICSPFRGISSARGAGRFFTYFYFRVCPWITVKHSISHVKEISFVGVGFSLPVASLQLSTPWASLAVLCKLFAPFRLRHPSGSTTRQHK